MICSGRHKRVNLARLLVTTVTADGEYVLCWRRTKKGARHGQDRRLLPLADLALELSGRV